MKILFFTELYYAGGLLRFIRDLVENWPKDDRLVFICNKNMPGIHEINRRFKGICEVVVHERGILPDYPEDGDCGHRRNKILNVLITISQYFQVGYHALCFNRLFSNYDPDRIMIINGGYPGGYTCRAAALVGLFKTGLKKPIMNYHNLPSKSKWLFTIPECLLDFLISQSVSFFVTVSKIANQQLRNRPGLFRLAGKFIYNGTRVPPVDEHRVDHGRVRDELGIGHQSPIVLMLATYEDRKGHEFLFKAFVDVIKEVPHARLVIAGHGTRREIKNVKKLAEGYKLSQVVHLLGFRKDTFRLLSQSQVVVVPSQYSESFGLTIIEAMAHRVPVVATQVGGIPEVLGDGKGGYTVPLVPELFAAKVVTLLKTPSLRQSIGDAGYAVVKERFDLNRMVREYYKLTREIV